MTLTKVEKTKLRTWVEIDRAAIRKNYQIFKKVLHKKCILMAVVKSNAYGHDLMLFTREVVKCGVNFLGVDSFEEALELRKAGIKVKILVFGYVSPEYYKEAAVKSISLTISNIPALEALSKVKFSKKLNVHIKAETGLGRQGFLEKDMYKVMKFLSSKSIKQNVNLEGLYSHLACGEDLEGREYTLLQARRLNVWDNAFKKAGYEYIKHLCASAGAMLYPELQFDMARIGIGMYGLWSSKELKLAVEKKYTMHPVLSWKAIITETKSLPKGTKVGYDLTEELKHDSTLAILPIGYYHGYPRALSRIGTFDLKGNKCKIIGTVCMDMVIVDITGVSAKVGDEVAIIGGTNKHYGEADVMAQDSDTINYEITTRINPIIKRFYRINPLIKRVVK